MREAFNERWDIWAEYLHEAIFGGDNDALI